VHLRNRVFSKKSGFSAWGVNTDKNLFIIPEPIMSHKIDTHHHFWKYNAEEYNWIDEKMQKIRRDFLPDELEDTIQEVGVTGVISVQARQTLQETAWLLNLASEHAFILGVVGWAPLTSPSVGRDLERFARHPKFKAVRHVLHDEPDDFYMLRDDFNKGISVLKSLELTYDLLIFEKHLPQTMKFVDRHPYQRFVVDHLAKPRIREGILSPWRENLKELAKREQVSCKLSGLVTEADDESWTEGELFPYMEITMEAFGPERVMFGSDWPACLVAATYKRWFDAASRYIDQLSETEQQQIWHQTAQEAYHLALPSETA
jgi:L-fuconolactonase